MSDPVAVTTTPPAPSTTQRLIAGGLAVLGALPLSGLFGPSSAVLKLAGLAIIGLAAAGYGVNSSALKTAHAAGRASAAL